MELTEVQEVSGTVMVIVGTVILLAGAIRLILNLSQSYEVIGTGLGILAGGLGFVADSALREIKRGEVDEKIAVISGFGGDQGGMALADLRALERVAKSATKSQACQIVSAGKTLLAVMRKGGLTTEADEGEKILNRILKRHHLSL